MIAEFVLIYRFTGFFLRPWPIPGADRNQDKPDEEYEARLASASRRAPEGDTPFPLGAGPSPRRQVSRQGDRYAMPL